MIYADEGFYFENYLLGREPVITAGFSFYARQASQLIDRYTFNRLKSTGVVPEVVQLCCCELAEFQFQTEQQRENSDGKTSEKIGTYSVTFETAKEAAESVAKVQREIIMRWLGNTGFCYRGCAHVY